jgi:integrase
MWKATIQVGHARKAVGRRGFASKREALRAMREALAKSDAGAFADPGKLTLGAWLDTWLEGVRVSPGTRQAYAQMIRVTIKPRIGMVPLSKVTSTRLNSLYRELEESGSTRGKPLSARSIQLAAAVLHMSLRAAVEAEPPLLARNPAAKASPPRVEHTDETVRAWTPAQLAAFMRWADAHDPERAPLWRLAAHTGMRRGELLGLEWRDLSGDVLSVRRNARPGADGGAVLGPTKSRVSRAVALDDEHVALLRSWRARRGGLHLSLVRDSAPVFADENGRHLRPSSVTDAFSRAVRACRKEVGEDDLPVISLHGLRHTMVTTWLTAGIPVKVVAERTGHTVALMLSTYAHVIPGSQAAAARDVARLLGPGAEAPAAPPNLRSVPGPQ